MASLEWWQLLMCRGSTAEKTPCDNLFAIPDVDVIKTHSLRSHLILNLLSEFRDDLEFPGKRSHGIPA